MKITLFLLLIGLQLVAARYKSLSHMLFGESIRLEEEEEEEEPDYDPSIIDEHFNELIAIKDEHYKFEFDEAAEAKE